MSGGVARGRLAEERKSWRKSHPYGFTAKPETTNLLLWHCTIPGPPNTDWEAGHYPITLNFTEDYPSKPPICKFPPNFFHPNVYSSGMVCLSILSQESGWRPSITVKQILTGIQEMLGKPNQYSPANWGANHLFVGNVGEYGKRVREQALQYPPPC